ncbi:hypothetical protein D3C78_1130050 [compost metagenome]
MQTAELGGRHHQHKRADGEHHSGLSRRGPNTPAGIKRIHHQFVEKRPCRADEKQRAVQGQREGRRQKQQPREKGKSELAGIDQTMQIVDRRRHAQHVEADEISRHQRQRQRIKRVKTRKARLQKKARCNRPFAQLPAIGMRQHETAERKEQIHGEIARSRAFPEQILGMAVDDEKGSHSPYAVEQYEAFRGRLDHGVRLGVAGGFKSSQATSFSA